MTNQSGRRKISSDSRLDSFASYSLLSPNGTVLNEEVDEYSWWSRGSSSRRGEMFNVGGGSPDTTEAEYVLDYGGYVLTPKNDFAAWVTVVGAGGGATNTSGGTHAGGGGYTKGLVKFKANVPYTLVIGEGGRSINRSTFGGGGRGHHGGTGGDGGGLSGLFMNVAHNSKTEWGHTYNTPVRREQAILIAGGGGGKGHHSQNHHGNGGGGGGWTGRDGHNSGPGTQSRAGTSGYNNNGPQGNGHGFHGGHSGSNTSWLGGGGGGWYGGGGGGHTSNHHNGGGGGSGHHAYPQEIMAQPNNDKAQFLVTAFTTRAAGGQSFGTWKPGNWRNPLIYNTGHGGAHAGRGGHGEGTTHGSRHGKVIIQFAPGYYDNMMKPFPDIDPMAGSNYTSQNNRGQNYDKTI
jgi:hypothetical protein